MIFPIDRKKTVFMSFLGKSYSDNPRAISEALHSADSTCKIIWVFKDVETEKKIVPDYVKCVRYGSPAMFWHMATAGVWVDNYRKGFETKKRNGQYYIQTWHGDRGFKNIPQTSAQLNGDYSECYERKYCDLAIAGSDFGAKTYREALHFDGEILQTGCPRNDILLNGSDSTVAQFKARYKIPQAAKILLYAPTFRDSNKSDSQDAKELDFAEIIAALEKKTGNDWCVVLRGHTGRTLNISNGSVLERKLFDATDYEDTKDVLLSSDALITDFSSLAGDFALLKRPLFLDTSGLNKFAEEDRTFIFDIRRSPFFFADSQQELINIIDALDLSAVPDNCKKILDFFGTTETGHSAEDIVKRILERQN
ncbi:MAG: hypothetical protein GX051_04215 [Clostridiales bacterium]|nr:hypothetical protein [Clostridiales bacterium]